MTQDGKLGGMKVAYEKPLCDQCGEDLILCEDFSFVLETRINKNGIRSKKPQRSSELSHSGVEQLHCRSCSATWDFKRDEKGRIIKVVS